MVNLNNARVMTPCYCNVVFSKIKQHIWLYGCDTVKWANNDKGLKDCCLVCDHFHFHIERTFGMKYFEICY
jgi:hypothetical protein